jgi:hypothetical protein
MIKICSLHYHTVILNFPRKFVRKKKPILAYGTKFFLDVTVIEKDWKFSFVEYSEFDEAKAAKYVASIK